MSEQAQATRWRFESEFVGLVVYHEGRKIESALAPARAKPARPHK